MLAPEDAFLKPKWTETLGVRLPSSNEGLCQTLLLDLTLKPPVDALRATLDEHSSSDSLLPPRFDRVVKQKPEPVPRNGLPAHRPNNVSKGPPIKQPSNQSTYLAIKLSVYLSLHLCVHLSAYSLTNNLPVYLRIHLTTYPYAYQSNNQTYLSIYLPSYQFVCLSVLASM